MSNRKKQAKKPTKSNDSGRMSIPVTTCTVIERHLRMAEAAAILGVSRPTLYRWLPRIRHRRIPAGGLTKEIVLIPESALAEFLKAYERPARAPGAAA